MEKRKMVVSNDYERNQVINFLTLLELDKPKLITIENKVNTRSKAQNSLLWLWNSAIQEFMFEHTGTVASALEWHDFLVERICPVTIVSIKLPNGETTYLSKRTQTSKFNIKQMTDYLEKLDAYCANNLGLLLPHPSDLINLAYGKRVNHAKPIKN